MVWVSTMRNVGTVSWASSVPRPLSTSLVLRVARKELAYTRSEHV